MSETFHYLGLALVAIIGLAMVAMGAVWILQGFGIAFLNSFMANDLAWARNGAILALAGLVQAAWAIMHRRALHG